MYVGFFSVTFYSLIIFIFVLSGKATYQELSALFYKFYYYGD